LQVKAANIFQLQFATVRTVPRVICNYVTVVQNVIKTNEIPTELTVIKIILPHKSRSIESLRKH